MVSCLTFIQISKVRSSGTRDNLIPAVSLLIRLGVPACLSLMVLVDLRSTTEHDTFLTLNMRRVRSEKIRYIEARCCWIFRNPIVYLDILLGL